MSRKRISGFSILGDGRDRTREGRLGPNAGPLSANVRFTLVGTCATTVIPGIVQPSSGDVPVTASSSIEVPSIEDVSPAELARAKDRSALSGICATTVIPGIVHVSSADFSTSSVPAESVDPDEFARTKDPSSRAGICTTTVTPGIVQALAVATSVPASSFPRDVVAVSAPVRRRAPKPTVRPRAIVAANQAFFFIGSSMVNVSCS